MPGAAVGFARIVRGTAESRALLRARGEFAQEPGALGCGGHERRVLSAEDKTGAHLDIPRHDRLIVDPDHSREFAVLSCSGAHRPVRVGNAVVAKVAVDPISNFPLPGWGSRFA